jgi:hypothetical protein
MGKHLFGERCPCRCCAEQLGATLLTRIPNGLSSRSRMGVKWTRAALLTE